MKIVDFTSAHIEQAAYIAHQNYNIEHGFVKALPPVDEWPDLTSFAENQLGVVAIDNDEVVGFLGCYGIWDNAWDIPGLRHIFSPMHANGTIPENRADIYARLYEAAAKKWVQAGIASHGICLYAHDNEGQAQFFRYGFGMRCIDAVRLINETDAMACAGYTFTELPTEELPSVYPLINNLNKVFNESPIFIARDLEKEPDFINDVIGQKSIFFIARYEKQIVAFIRAELNGETFIKDTPGYLHCNGLYCLPEHRGKGVNLKLLNLLLGKLKSQGYTRFGVDFESINPLASRFWLKHFSAYTHSVVRRIDENVIMRAKK